VLSVHRRKRRQKPLAATHSEPQLKMSLVQSPPG
jgi:hypothetical protein